METDWRLFHTFTKEILATLTDRVCAARPPRYAEILDMDRKLAEHESRVTNILDACISLIPKESLQTLDRQTQMNFNTPNLMGSLGMSIVTHAERLDSQYCVSDDVHPSKLFCKGSTGTSKPPS